MSQPASERIVTEQLLADKIDSDVPGILGSEETQLLSDQFRKPNPKSVPQTNAVVSLTTGFTVDGLEATGSQLFLPSEVYDIAECNWNEQTLTYFGSSGMNSPKSSGVATCFDFTTLIEGKYAVFTFLVLDQVTDFRVWVDDVPVVDWYNGTRATGVLQTNTPEMHCDTPNVGYFININFPVRGIHKIRVSGGYMAMGESIIRCNAEGKFHKPKKQRVMGVISDSWYETMFGSNTTLDTGVEVITQMGWKQWNLAVSGSGFVNPSTFPNGPHHFSSDAVFAALTKAPPMDLLLLNGSVNDMGYSETEVVNAMKVFFDRWRSVRPETPIVWQGLEPQAYFESVYTTQAMIAREEALRITAEADPLVIGTILTAKENWLTGTGSSVNPNGTGNQDFYIGGDEIHLSPLGCRFTGRLVAERMASMPTWKNV